MPIYEYKCSSCGITIVEAKSLNDRDDSPTCDYCNLPTKRVYSSVGVTFNGSGFYSNDK